MRKQIYPIIGNEVYFDMDVLTCNPSTQKVLLDLFEDRINNLINKGVTFNKIAFMVKNQVPIGAIVLAFPISQIFGKEIVFIRPWIKLPHLKVVAPAKHENESTLCSNDGVLLIDDVIATGSTQVKAIELVEGFGAKVKGIVCAFVVKEGVDKIKNAKGIEYIENIRTYDELVAFGFINPNTYQLLSQDLEQDLVKEVLPRYLDESEAAAAMDALENLSEALDDMIAKTLNEHGVEADENMRRGLKNLYLSNLMMRAQFFSQSKES